MWFPGANSEILGGEEGVDRSAVAGYQSLLSARGQWASCLGCSSISRIFGGWQASRAGSVGGAGASLQVTWFEAHWNRGSVFAVY